MKKYLFLIASLGLVGCAAHSGNQVLADLKHEDLKVKLVENKTTADEIRQLLGDPKETKLNLDGSEEWVYELVRADAKAANFIPIVNLFASGADTDTKTLRLLLNKDRVLVKYLYSSSKGEFKQGLF